MTQEERDLFDKLTNVDTVCVYRENLTTRTPYLDAKIRDIVISKYEKSYIRTDQLDFTFDEYGKYWAFTEDDLRKMRKENKRAKLEKKIKQCQEKLKELEEE